MTTCTTFLCWREKSCISDGYCASLFFRIIIWCRVETDISLANFSVKCWCVLAEYSSTMRTTQTTFSVSHEVLFSSFLYKKPGMVWPWSRPQIYPLLGPWSSVLNCILFAFLSSLTFLFQWQEWMQIAVNPLSISRSLTDCYSWKTNEALHRAMSLIREKYLLHLKIFVNVNSLQQNIVLLNASHLLFEWQQKPFNPFSLCRHVQYIIHSYFEDCLVKGFISDFRVGIAWKEKCHVWNDYLCNFSQILTTDCNTILH